MAKNIKRRFRFSVFSFHFMVKEPTGLNGAASLKPATPLRSRRSRPLAPHPQSGFSLVEMSVAALILAIGILGLTMLQAMSLKVARGSANSAIAVLIAEQIMDRVELEGRLSWLNVTDSSGFKYITLAKGGTADDKFNARGELVEQASDDPAFFTASTRREPIESSGPMGFISDVSVRVEYKESAKNNEVVTREFILTRRITHG